MHLKSLQIKLAGFYLRIGDLFLPPDIKGLNVRDIYPLLFQRGHFQRPLVLHIFLTLSVKYKASKTTLCRRFVLELYSEPSQTSKKEFLHMIIQEGTRAASV